MRNKAWLLFAIMPVVLVGIVFLLARRPSPAPASGGEPARPVAVNKADEARALMERLKERAELAASAKPIAPKGLPGPMAEPMPGAIRLGPEGQGQVDEQKATAALQKLRARMDLEKKTAGGRISLPRVAAIMAGADNKFCALVGDALVSEGDTVQGYRVRAIRTDAVEFERDGQTWTQKVN